jgi:uracil-DNA glycosylase
MDPLALLRLQMDWGVDEALDDAPIDRLRPVPVVPATRVREARPASAAVPAGTPVERALRAAAAADSLDALKTAIAGFEGDPLRDMATNLVFASGDPNTGLLAIGGPPGADEDRSGIPFSGREGALLDRMLASIGLKRDALLLTHIIPWRPPGGRVPNPGELQLYRLFLSRLIALAAPGRIILFGALPVSVVLGTGHRARKVVWAEASVDGHPRRVLVMPGLADMIRAPERRKDAWSGMRLLRRALDGDSSAER